jgi:hypothetical protein
MPITIEDCPVGSVCPYKGMFAPISCQLSRNLSGFYCPRNSDQPVPCPAGFFCNSTSSSYKCPEGAYCKEFSYKAAKCPALSSCPEGASSPNSTSLLVIIVVCTLALSSVLYLWKTRRFFFAESISLEEEDEEEEEGVSVDEKEFDPETASFQRLNVGFDNLGLVLNSGRRVLSQMTGELKGGTLTAIMGPSGSGKSVC